MLAPCRTLIAALTLFVTAAMATAQTSENPPPTKPSKARQTVVTATRLMEDPFDVPYSIDVIGEESLRRRSYRTTPQALRDIPGVMVQETAHGHGSPYIRGFTSFRTLFLVDGIRLNNSVFRPGPNQYWNTVNPSSLDRFEIVKGPSSVLHGSDAIGGTVHAITRSPDTWAATVGFAYGGHSSVRYATAEDSLQGRGEMSLGHTWDDGAKTGILIGGSARSFGDLEGGRSVGNQPDTGYDETDFDIKVQHGLDADTRVVFLHQRVAQNDVPRTHRTVNGIRWQGLASGSDLQRDFDQDRRLTYLQLHRENIGSLVDTVRASVSWHRQQEVRDRIRSNTNRELQGFDVGTLGAWVQLASDTPAGRLTYGAEFYRDYVSSFLRRLQDPQPGDGIQGPVADDATYDLLGVYVQDSIEVMDNLALTLGARFQWAAADAGSVRHPVTSTRTSLHDDWTALVGSARLRYVLVPGEVHLFGGVSQGFRAPNLSDLSRFDSARSNELEIPSPGLDPEHYISYEIGGKVETERLAAQSSIFYTDIRDQILRFPTGGTSAGGETIVTKANVGDGYVAGIEVGASVRILDDTTVFGNATLIDGRITNFESTASTLQETYPTRLMPFSAQLGARWEDSRGRFWAESVVVWAKKADRLSFSDQRDTTRIPAGGTPGYAVWHARCGWNLSEQTSVQVLLENITNADYRVHGSGLNRPGRNLIFGISARL